MTSFSAVVAEDDEIEIVHMRLPRSSRVPAEVKPAALCRGDGRAALELTDMLVRVFPVCRIHDEFTRELVREFSDFLHYIVPPCLKK